MRHPVVGRTRCYLHGGNNPGGWQGASTAPAKAGQLRKVALLHALGLKWYGGRTPKAATVVRRMDEAIKATDALVAVLPAGGGLKTQHAVVLDEGSLEGLVLQRGTVRMVQSQMDLLGPAIDVKLLRAGNEAARDLTKLAVRVAEGAFRAQEGNALLALLEQLKAAQDAKEK